MFLKNMVISEKRSIEFNFFQLMNVGNIFYYSMYSCDFPSSYKKKMKMFEEAKRMTSVSAKDNLKSHYQCTVSQCVWRSCGILIKFLVDTNKQKKVQIWWIYQSAWEKHWHIWEGTRLISSEDNILRIRPAGRIGRRPYDNHLMIYCKHVLFSL